MKLRNKIAAITAAAMLAFAGVGFAAWHFTNVERASVSNITGEVTAAIEAKNLRVEDGHGTAVTGLYLICDAPTAAELSDAGITGLAAGNGIYWSTEDSNDVSKKITSLTLVGEREYDDNDIADFTTYVGNFSSAAYAGYSAGTWIELASTAALDYDTPATAVSTAEVSTTWTLPVPSYKAIPATVANVNALETEANALNLTFSFEFTIKSIA